MKTEHPRVYSNDPLPPGRILRREIEYRGVSRNELARQMGRPVELVNGVINADIPVTPDIARAIEKALGIKAYLWTNLEASYRATLAHNQAGSPPTAPTTPATSATTAQPAKPTTTMRTKKTRKPKSPPGCSWTTANNHPSPSQSEGDAASEATPQRVLEHNPPIPCRRTKTITPNSTSSQRMPPVQTPTKTPSPQPVRNNPTDAERHPLATPPHPLSLDGRGSG